MTTSRLIAIEDKIVELEIAATGCHLVGQGHRAQAFTAMTDKLWSLHALFTGLYRDQPLGGGDHREAFSFLRGSLE